MKKLMIAALAAVALVGVANAVQAYGLFGEAWATPYSKDTAPGDEHGAWYSCYALKQEDAQKLVGAAETVTYETVAAWLVKDFDANKKTVIDNADQIPYTEYSSAFSGSYAFLNMEGGPGSDLWSAIGFFFYNDGANVAYCVGGGLNYMAFSFNVQQNATGWQTVGDVPEPTSGLLVLLGVAALSLRRKRG